MAGGLILVFFLIRYLRKSLQTSVHFQQWDKIFFWAKYVLPALIVLDVTVIPHSISMWLGYLILFGVIYITLLLRELNFIRNLIFAVLPFIAVSFIRDVVKLLSDSLYNKIEFYINIIYPCAIVWMIAMLITYNKQRKALKKERDKREKEEEQNRIMAIKKAELEEMVTERTAELMQQKEELQQAVLVLKETQSQLIQKEKMASLGELTAGIAHEIQNPLNFVNNFSEVNAELIDELQNELNTGNKEEAIFLANNIKDNELKIIHHGKRADAIVKGMLQHSRSSTSQQEPADINALADEYLRLSYHGLRAKDKSFNATMQTDFDKSIGPVNIIPQDIGRVLLNLFNNAFYAVTEKKKQQREARLPDGQGYEPTVSASTKKENSKIIIKVRDNGTGISQKVLDKIYQPFFTTKPTGQGTGLGLSLSYDIVKAHGGEIKVETKEGEGAEFIILLPVV